MVSCSQGLGTFRVRLQRAGCALQGEVNSSNQDLRLREDVDELKELNFERAGLLLCYLGVV